MTIGVTGGTGFVGRELITRLTGDGHSVRVVTRSASRTDALLPLSSVEIAVGRALTADVNGEKPQRRECTNYRILEALRFAALLTRELKFFDKRVSAVGAAKRRGTDFGFGPVVSGMINSEAPIDVLYDQRSAASRDSSFDVLNQRDVDLLIACGPREHVSPEALLEDLDGRSRISVG